MTALSDWLSFGDSLSSGYHMSQENGFVPQLQNALKKEGLDNITVINAAVAGDTTANGLGRINDVLALSPHAVIVELGINDVLQDVSFDVAESNLDKILKTFKDKDIPVLLVGMRAPFLTNQKSREDFIGMYQRLSKKYKLVLYPYFLDGVLIDRFGIYDLKYMQDDGAHPNEQGVLIMVQRIMPTLTKFLNNL